MTNYYPDNKYDIHVRMINHREHELIVNAIKRQVDYYRNRVFNLKPNTDDKSANNTKYNYKVYCDLYDKIIKDYNDIVNE